MGAMDLKNDSGSHLFIPIAAKWVMMMMMMMITFLLREQEYALEL